jgi:type VI secretion system protein ImpK
VQQPGAAPYAPPAPNPYAAPGYPPPPAYPGAPPAAPYPGQPMPPAYGTAPQTPQQEDWIQTQREAPQQLGAQTARLNELRLDELAAPHENPIMRSAGPLLLLLGRLRVALMRASFASLMEQVAEAIKFFEKDIRSAGIPEDQANIAKYLLCATADDIVQNIPTEDRHVWAQYSMLSRFFGERIGGVRFFEELEQKLKDPLVNYPLLELQHACLALGFQGLHRTTPNGQMQLQTIQRNLYEVLRRIRPKVIHDLSPRWQGQKLVSRVSRFRVPVWIAASVAGMLLLLLFIGLRTLLGNGAEQAAAATLALHPPDKVELARRVVAPPPPPPPPPPVNRVTQLQRICAQLGPDCNTTVSSRRRPIRSSSASATSCCSSPARLTCARSSSPSPPRSRRRWKRSRASSRSSATPTASRSRTSASRRTSTSRWRARRRWRRCSRRGSPTRAVCRRKARARTSRSPATRPPKDARRTGASRC